MRIGGFIPNNSPSLSIVSILFKTWFLYIFLLFSRLYLALYTAISNNSFFLPNLISTKGISSISSILSIFIPLIPISFGFSLIS